MATMTRGGRTRTPAEARLWDATARRTTRQLMDAHEHLTATPQAELEQEHRITMAYIADVITERHALMPELERIFSDEEYAGTYHDALKEALHAAGVTY